MSRSRLAVAVACVVLFAACEDGRTEVYQPNNRVAADGSLGI